MRNWKTTLIGFVIAFMSYFKQAGFVLPTTEQEWTAALFAALIAALGAVSKDYNNHSTDDEVTKSTLKEGAREFGKDL